MSVIPAAVRRAAGTVYTLPARSVRQPNNGLGVAGVDQQARVQPVRAIGTCGGWASDVADAIRWAAGLPVPGVPLNPTPAKVLNLSLGGAWPCSLIEQSAIDAAVAPGQRSW